MKVAYNACYGKFSLSPEGLTMFAERKGITLTWYKQEKYHYFPLYHEEEYKRLENTPKSDLPDLFPLTEDIGEQFQKIPDRLLYHPKFHDDMRNDTDLIKTIEYLGERADGIYSWLQIKEIPDGASFEITENGGKEMVEPPRSTW